jgi:hypothetical protein
VSPLPPRAKIEILKTNIARRAVGRYSAVISQHRRDAYDTFRSATSASRGERSPVLRRSGRVQPVISTKLSFHGPLGWRPNSTYIQGPGQCPNSRVRRPALLPTYARPRALRRTFQQKSRLAPLSLGKAGRLTYRNPQSIVGNLDLRAWQCVSCFLQDRFFVTA